MGVSAHTWRRERVQQAILRRMIAWTAAEVLKLIDLWKEDGIQVLLEGSIRNKHVYENSHWFQQDWGVV